MSTEVTPVSSFTPAIHANNAREQLLQGLRLAERQVVYFKNALAALDALERRTGYGLESLPAVKPKEFQGERLMNALKLYLKGRGGLRIPLSRAIADLLEGEVALGKQTPSHTLRLGLPNSPDIFDFHPKENYKTPKGRDRTRIPDGVKDEEVTVWLVDGAYKPKRRVRKS